MPGPGTRLHDMIEKWTGEKPNLSCSCATWIRKMDRDPAWAKANVNLIVSKLLREAQARAVQWKAVPVQSDGTLLNAAKTRAWRGAFLVPGAGLMLRVFVRRMVEEALKEGGVA